MVFLLAPSMVLHGVEFSREEVIHNELAPTSIFLPLTGLEIKDIAMLEYYLVYKLLEEEVDILAETSDIRTDELGVRIEFGFSGGVSDSEEGICLIPCKCGEAEYWCLVKKGEGRVPYEFVFYTAAELAGKDLRGDILRRSIAKRMEQAALDAARKSEKEHDEKIRAAINAGNFMPITYGNAPFSMMFVSSFLPIVASRLADEFQELLDDGQVMIITETREGLALDEPHAGGQGIYLPPRPEFLNAGTMIHEIFAKAGFTYEEANSMRSVFEKYVVLSSDSIVDSPGKLPENIELSGPEKRAVERARIATFGDLYKNIKKRDYSVTGNPARTELLPQPIFTCDGDGRLINASGELLKCLGYTEEDMKAGLNILGFVTPVERSVMKANIDRLLGDPDAKARGKEYTVVKKDRSESVALIFMDPDTGGDKGKIISGMIIDVTAKKKAESALVQERRKYDEMLTVRLERERIMCGIAEMFLEAEKGMDDAAVDESLSRAGRMLGGDRCYLFIFDDKGKNILSINEWRGQGIQPVEKKSLRTDNSLFRWAKKRLEEGKIISASVSDVPNKADGRAVFCNQIGAKSRMIVPLKSKGIFCGFVGIDTIKEIKKWSSEDESYLQRVAVILANNILRKRSEEALRNEEEKYRQIYDGSPIGIAQFGFDGRPVMAPNTRFVDILSLAGAESLQGLDLFRIIGSMDEEALGKVRKGEPVRLEKMIDLGSIYPAHKMELTDMPDIFVDLQVTPLSSGYLVHLQDITARKKAESELKEAIARLVQSERFYALSECAVAIAHEVNNPASNLMFEVEDLLGRLERGETVSNEEIEKSLRIVEEENNRVIEITSRFLGLARTRSEKVPCFVEDVVSGAVELRRTSLRAEGIDVNMDLAEEWSVIIGNKGELRQAVHNMIINASKAMKDSTVKKLFVSTQRITGAAGQPAVCVTISDTGCGISKDMIDKIWDPFFSSRKDGTGSGIGLSIVRETVMDHGGEITVSSAPGKGTEFTMMFPVVEGEKELIQNMAGKESIRIFRKIWHDLNGLVGGLLGLGQLMMFEEVSDHERSVLSALDSRIEKAVKSIKEAQTLCHDYEKKGTDIPVEKEEKTFREVISSLSDMENNIKSLDEESSRSGEENADKKEIVSQMGEVIESIKPRVKQWVTLLDIMNVLKGPARSVGLIETLEGMAGAFKCEQGIFVNNNVNCGNIEGTTIDMRTSPKIMAQLSAFRYVLYNAMMVGLKESGVPLQRLTPEKKLLRISVQLNARTGEAVISLKNNYCLFDPAQIASILEWKGKDSTALAVAQRVLAGCGGRMTVENDGENGSTVRIFITYFSDRGHSSIDAKVSGARRSADGDNSRRQGAHLLAPENIRDEWPNMLIVDDESLQHKAFEKLFGNEGINIWTAYSGQEGYDAAVIARDLGHPITVAVVDVTMPSSPGDAIFGGIALVNELRRKGFTFPIIISTGHAIYDEELVRLEREGIVTAILSKTMPVKEKKTFIRDIIDNEGSGDLSSKMQMVTAGKTALLYGPDPSKFIAKLRVSGFKGEIVTALDEEGLRNVLLSDSHFDIIINSSGQDIRALVEKILSNIAERPPIVDFMESKELLSRAIISVIEASA